MFRIGKLWIFCTRFTGSVWKEKVLKCTKMILKYLARASVPFQPLLDKVSIFNSDIAQSSVHSLACHDGRVCVENTQIYALLCKSALTV
ncbi:hypothetical protein DPMN_054784 [Dreissena polymorpha]|uniref:Uncharacterized protein n=1 Tax=Dreissena polymorpha TaxID=45954 RepID=A0A9D4CPJ1_DREPO|nr:hypothetical protein DPMN_054784 [Dreissena polymorpha]